MPTFRSTSNSAKPVLMRLSAMLSIKIRPYSYAMIDKIKINAGDGLFFILFFPPSEKSHEALALVSI